MIGLDSAEKPSWSKNLKFFGDQITLPISQKPLDGLFRALVFGRGLCVYFSFGKGGVFQQNLV
jgi:hypothetical protein